MSEYGLDPGPISWDRRVHHFPGKGKAEKNKSAWYVAFDDRTGGVFGDYSQGLPEKGIPWQMKRDRPPTKAEREEWARRDRESLKRQAKARKRATAEVQAAWEAAVPANRTSAHPYLVAKRRARRRMWRPAPALRGWWWRKGLRRLGTESTNWRTGTWGET